MVKTKNRAASTIVRAPFSEEVVKEAATKVRAELGAEVSCGLVFIGKEYKPHLEDFLEIVRVYARVPLLVGCTGSGLIGSGVEDEDGIGFSLILLSMPDTKITPIQVTQTQIEEAEDEEYWRRHTKLDPAEVDAFIVMLNPFEIAVEDWTDQWNASFPGVPAIGGLASSQSEESSETILMRDGELLEAEGIILALSGGVTVRTIVSQGCRPIGEPLTITAVRENFVLTLGSRPAFEVLNSVFSTLSEKDRAQAQGNLFVGLAMNEYVEDFKRGDFLRRHILGADLEAKAAAVAGSPRMGQTFQYQLRDKSTAEHELRELMVQAKDELTSEPFAVLLFSCTGRGKNLFGKANHDAQVVQTIMGPLPSAGFFCNGEVGPVGKTNFIHSYTASIAVLCDLATE